jgi:hypothetical protein
MAFSLGNWRPRHLLLSWVAYWLLLLATIMRPALVNVISAITAPDGHGTISANMADGVVSLLVKSDAATWTGSASLTSIALWIAGPPLLLFALWMATRTRATPVRERLY